MTIEIFLVLMLVAAAVALFASEKLPVDLVALLLMAVLLLSGLVSPEEGIAGFSNTATVTVAAMFVISAALFRTGAVETLGQLSARVFRYNLWAGLAVMMLTVGVLSAFINNTPVVAIFMPIVLTVSASIQVSPSKILMPLSFASMFGGVCTLIGTSTNILVSSIAERSGYAPFSMFEFSKLGVLFFAAGTAYMLLYGVRHIPARREAADLTRQYGMGRYLTEIVLQEGAKSVGATVAQCPLVTEVGVEILEIDRGDLRMVIPSAHTVLEAGDLLRVVGDVEKIKALAERQGINLRAEKFRDQDLATEDRLLVEAVVAPGSDLAGQTLKSTRFRNTFGANVLAIRHRGTVRHENLGDTVLQAGDVLLTEIRRDHLPALQSSEAFVMVSEVALPKFRTSKVPIAVAIVAGVIVTAATGILPIVVSAIAGCVLLVLTGCITLDESYRAIDWKVIFLLAGALTLGAALEKSGAAALLAGGLVKGAGILGPIAVVSAFYLLTSVLTEAMSNNATAVLLAPIAIGAAQVMEVDPRPLLMAVTFAASASFMTPVGYQTNTMIYGVGQYKFRDFLRIGTPLNIMFWIMATVLIPVFWPLT